MLLIFREGKRKTQCWLLVQPLVKNEEGAVGLVCEQTAHLSVLLSNNRTLNGDNYHPLYPNVIPYKATEWSIQFHVFLRGRSSVHTRQRSHISKSVDSLTSLTRNQPPLLSVLHTYEQLAFSFLDDIKGFWRLKK